MITAYLVGDEQLLERLRALPDAINSGLARSITQLGIDLQRNVRQDKLSGQVLRSRTGALKSSIDLRVDQGARSVSASVFTDLRYGAAQEYGFAGTVSVGASLRWIREVLRSADRREDNQRASAQSPYGSPGTLVPALGARGHDARDPRSGGGGCGGSDIAMIMRDAGFPCCESGG